MSYATYTASETVAMHAATRAELNAPITGGKLAKRFNSANHGLTVGNMCYGPVPNGKVPCINCVRKEQCFSTVHAPCPVFDAWLCGRI